MHERGAKTADARVTCVGVPDAGAPTIQQRDAEIGRVVRAGRERLGHGKVRCADVIRVSAVRYGRMESGKTGISVGQLERLARFLEIPVSVVFPQALPRAPGEAVPVLVTARIGQSVQIVVNVVQARLPSKRPWHFADKRHTTRSMHQVGAYYLTSLPAC